MAIGTAIQKGRTVYVYDEKGRVLFTKSAGNAPPEGLHGYTSGTVSIRKGITIYTYNEKGHAVSTKTAR
jgi:predicted lipoprotein with Yx(FWY)xxD motif